MRQAREPVEREPLIAKLAAEVNGVKDDMARIFYRQNRWRTRDLHAAVGGFPRCSGTTASLAVFALMKDGAAHHDREGFLRAGRGE